MIKFNNVAKAYEDEKYVVSDVNLEIKEGDFFVIIGPSGSGKTTLLKMINRLIPLTEGHIYVKNRPISEYNIQELRWNMGYVLQQIALFPNMTVEENIQTVPEMKKWSAAEMKNRVTYLLDSVGLDPETYRKRKTSELSGGEQQRIGVLRAFAADPDIILMDEPFSALDPVSRQSLQNDLVEMHQKYNKTIVFVTHDMQEAILLGTRIALMEKGKIVQVGTPDEIVHSPKNEFVRNFLTSGHIETEEQLIEELIEENFIEPVIEAQPNIQHLTTKDSVDDLILALSKQDVVTIEKPTGEVIGQINQESLLAYLANQIESRGERA